MIKAASVLAIVPAMMLSDTASARQQLAECDAKAELATLIETVRDRVTRVPLSGAVITAAWPGSNPVRVTTDSAGRARICAPAGRPITTRISYYDVRAPAQSFILSPGRITEHTFAVDPLHVFVRGTVIDELTGVPVVYAGVRVANTPLVTTTNAEGKFAFERVPIGDYRLHVQHISYAAVSLPLPVRSEDLDAAIRLLPAAIALEPIVVTGFSLRLDHVGFYERQKRGMGTFINRRQIDAMNVQRSSDLLSRVPSMRLIPQITRRNVPQNATIGRGNCRFRFVVDGTRTLSDFEMDMVAAHAIEGVEIYSGLSEVPAEFRAVADIGAASCGVIAIWTRDRR